MKSKMKNDAFNLMYQGSFSPFRMYIFKIYTMQINCVQASTSSPQEYIINTGIITSVNVVMNDKCATISQTDRYG